MKGVGISFLVYGGNSRGVWGFCESFLCLFFFSVAWYVGRGDLLRLAVLLRGDNIRARLDLRHQIAYFLGIATQLAPVAHLVRTSSSILLVVK